MRLETLLTHPAVQALGRSLLHFLWQGSLLALLLWMVKTIAPASARVRYAAASLVILAMPVALVVTVARDLRREQPAVSMVPMVSSHAQAPAETSREILLAALPTSGSSFGVTGWVVCIWIAGVFLLSLRASGGWVRAQRLKRRVLPASGELENMMTRLKRRLGVSAPVRLYTSAIVQVPTVIGWLRPYILLPVTAIIGLSESQLRAILAHELAHIRRHDYLVNLLQTAIETVLFYHPAVWWVGKQMRIEREHCCDDIAVAICGNAIEYAEALAELEQLRGRIPEPALAATGGDLLGRIRRLLGQRPSEERASRSLGALAAAALVLFLAGVPAMRSLKAAPQPPETAIPQPVAQPAAQLAAQPKPLPKIQIPALPEIPDIQPVISRMADTLRAVNLDAAAMQADLAAQVDRLAPAPATAATSQDRTKTVGLLIKLFDSEKDAQMKRAILAYLGESPDPRAQEKLLAIFRSDSDLGMRRSALAYLAEQPKSFDALVSLYDSETNIEMKKAMLAYISDSDDPRAADKLMSVVQSDAPVEVRRAALAYLAGR
jgi:beta-lactamase regulating signal transducer with metallopeptidase domain